MASGSTRKGGRGPLPWLCGFAGALIALALVPRLACGWGAAALLRGDETAQVALAEGMEDWIAEDLGEAAYHTGGARFDGEWLFATYMMAGMGFGQVALQHPERRDRALASMETCIDRLLEPRVRRFDIAAWGEDPLDTLGKGGDHAGYLGYLGLLLSFHVSIDPDSRFADLADRVARAEAHAVSRSPILLAETYPGEVYPIDNCAVMAGVLLHAQATGRDRDGLARRWKERLERDWTDSDSGLLYQRVGAVDGAPRDLPRASGTSMCAYFLSFVDPPYARTLHRAVVAQGEPSFLGFSGMREWPRGIDGGWGDVDSGPVILGMGVTATGVSLGNARIHGDDALFVRLYRTANLVGAPVRTADGTHFAAGGPVGDALMFAFLTARRATGPGGGR